MVQGERERVKLMEKKGRKVTAKSMLQKKMVIMIMMTRMRRRMIMIKMNIIVLPF